MDAGPRIDSYEWSGGREPMLRFGPADSPVAVLALPLFEEANRTRAFGVGILRALAVRGIGGALPELPGQGESERATEGMRFSDLRAAFASVPATHHIAIRSGALIVGGERPCWLFAPQDAERLAREIGRTRSAQDGQQRPDRTRPPEADLSTMISRDNKRVLQIAGNIVQVGFLDELAAARKPIGRVVRPASDPAAADLKIDGVPLWRRAEPDNDRTLVEVLAADIASWIAACAD